MTGAPLDDRGLLLGDGLFETLLARDGQLILLDEHLARMAGGCAVLGLPSPDASQARAACETALDAAGLQRGRAAVRLTMTAGSGGRGLDRPEAPIPRLFATAALAPPAGGVTALRTASIRRNTTSPASRLKSLSYLDNILARREVAPDEALMLNERGEVACAAVANIFWLMGDRLETPSLDCGVLPGIMRAHLVRAAADMGVEVREVRAPRAALDEADAVFLTNSLVGLRQVSSLDGVDLASPPLVDALAEALGEVSS